MLRTPGLASCKVASRRQKGPDAQNICILGCSFGGGRHEASDLGRIQTRFGVQTMLVQHTFVIAEVIRRFRKHVAVTDLIC